MAKHLAMALLGTMQVCLFKASVASVLKDPICAATDSPALSAAVSLVQRKATSLPHSFEAKPHGSNGTTPDLQADELFITTVSKNPGRVHTVSENCPMGWSGNVNCAMEYPEHTLVRKWIPQNATVMEFGARFGTTTCELANQLNNSGRLVAVEPDRNVWDNLASNLMQHNCHAHMLRGAVSGSPVRMLGSSYGGRSATKDVADDSHLLVPTYTFDDVEKALGLNFDTLLIDCEGCAQDMMDQIGPKISTQINLIVLEADASDNEGSSCKHHCMNYTPFFDFLETNGFEQVDKVNDCDRERTGTPENHVCLEWIDHYAFLRRAPIAAVEVVPQRS